MISSPRGTLATLAFVVASILAIAPDSSLAKTAFDKDDEPSVAVDKFRRLMPLLMENLQREFNEAGEKAGEREGFQLTAERKALVTFDAGSVPSPPLGLIVAGMYTRTAGGPKTSGSLAIQMEYKDKEWRLTLCEYEEAATGIKVNLAGTEPVKKAVEAATAAL